MSIKQETRHQQILDQNQTYINKLRKLREQKIGNATIIDPWSEQITPQKRASIHLNLLGKTYGQGHPGSQERKEELQKRQFKKNMLTWIVCWEEQPVGMVNFEIQNGIADAVRSVSVPIGTKLKNETIYRGQANISVAMYQRFFDILKNPNAIEKIYVIEGDVRMATEIRLPNGKILPSGTRTQHINHQSELTPFLICNPRYQVSPKKGKPHRETFLVSRKYLDTTELNLNAPLYTPTQHPLGKTTNAEIAQSTYYHAYQITPQIIDHLNQPTSPQTDLLLKRTAGTHFSTLYLTGKLDQSKIDTQIKNGLKQSGLVEIHIPNRPENIDLQYQTMKLGAISLGIVPGGKFYYDEQTHEIETIHCYGIARPEVINRMVEIEIAQDYRNTGIEKLSHAIREEWREHRIEI